MQLYISQLLEDFKEVKEKRNASKGQMKESKPSFESDEPDFSYIDQYLNGPEYPLSQILGIEKIQLPPLERLEEVDPQLVEKLYYGIIDMLEAFCFDPYFPDNLPVRIRYEVLRNNWEMELPVMEEGIVGIEYCNYNPENCPFGVDYCACKDHKNDPPPGINDMGDEDPDALPF